ncbi:hypothetical protein JTE90_012843, partial [Oedothorax gibbosus]
RIKLNGVELYCDSTTVLAWNRSSPESLRVYVANRVAKINELTKDVSWLYVRTKDNPADLISRGVWPDQIGHMEIWWRGPNFLYDNESPPQEAPALLPTDDYSAELRPPNSFTALPTAVDTETVDLLNSSVYCASETTSSDLTSSETTS